jgi:hypothetical protein
VAITALTGIPAQSLTDPAVRERFGVLADIGAAGERTFAARLAREMPDYSVWHSCHIPDDPQQRHNGYAADVDLIVASGSRMVLVDVKRWAGGHYRTAAGVPFVGLAPLVRQGRPWRLSGVLAAAVARYGASLAWTADVTALVAFETVADPIQVSGLLWPGAIRSYTARTAVEELRSRLGPAEPPTRAMTRLLDSMVWRPPSGVRRFQFRDESE